VSRRAQSSFQLRQLRLTTGLILFTYVTTHFLNHAAGLLSLHAMDVGSRWFVGFWRFPLCSAILYLALLTHFLLALWAIYQRRRLLDMSRGEALRLLLGLSIIPLLSDHAIGTHVANAKYGVADSYTYVLLSIWYYRPMDGVAQATALVVAWFHGCMGLYFWMRLKPWYLPAQPYLYGAALLVPVLALLGFAEGGMTVARLAEDPDWLRDAYVAMHLPPPANVATLEAIAHGIDRTFWTLLGLTLLARQVRTLVERRRGLVRLTYPGGREIAIVPGLTVLEVSQLHGIPHAAVCGGRGRCSTCRVRITNGFETLPPPASGEKAVLARVNAAPNVRLACQIRPSQDISVVPLLPPTAGPHDSYEKAAHLQGREKEIAVLFGDLRSFTQLAERKLPYDVVFLLNRYFAAMGQAIERSGGHVDKFIGDGVMALFGAGEGGEPALACRQALRAAREMGLALESLNKTLVHDLEAPLRIGIGIHIGPTIVGQMGHGHAVSLTAIGDTVNTASRLESLTKELGVELVISDDVARRGGIELTAFPPRDTEIRGRERTLLVRAIPHAHDLPDIVTEPAPAG
jgi:adenylate cyclase